MARRDDLSSIMVIGSGPIVIGQRVNSTIPARRPAKCCELRGTA